MNNTMYIMCDTVVPDEACSMNIINESAVPNTEFKTVTIDTVLQSFEVKNWNQRIYGGDLVMSSLDNDPLIQNDISKGQWMGEWGHPLDQKPHRQVTLNNDTVSHRILNYRREGNLLKGHVQTVPLGKGICMYANIMCGIPAAFSLRSLGSFDLETGRVNAPLRIVTYDSVYRPSHVEAYQTNILTEAVGSDGRIFTTDDFSLNEAVAITESDFHFLTECVKNNSDNVKKVADIFKLNDLQFTMNESGTRTNIIIDKNTTVNIPVEKTISMMYGEMLNSFVNKKYNK